MSSNAITITGNLGGDPEMRFTPTGIAVVRFSVGVTERYKDGNEWKDRDTSWFNVVAWRELAENCAATLNRGNRVTVTGPIRQRSWEDKEGEKRTVYEINADEIAASLKYATARITKVRRDAPGPDDPWAAGATPGGPETAGETATETAGAARKGSRAKAGTGQ
jgi:single-strand DNA-binding protein